MVAIEEVLKLKLDLESYEILPLAVMAYDDHSETVKDRWLFSLTRKVESMKVEVDLMTFGGLRVGY